MAWKAKLNAQGYADENAPRPRGAAGCFAGLTIVRTGELRTLSDKGFITYVYILGGKATSAVSGKTSYLVRGANPGATKEAAATKNGTKIISENEFYDLVRYRSEKITGKKCAEVDFKYSIELGDSEPQVYQVEIRVDRKYQRQPPQLWTVKYEPISISNMVGNNALLYELQDALLNVTGNRIFVSGPPGVGKSLFFKLLKIQCASKLRIIIIGSDYQRTAQIIRSLVENYSFTHQPLVFVFDDADSIEPQGIPQIVKLASAYYSVKFVLVAQDAGNTKFGTFKNGAFHAALRRPQKPLIAKYLNVILQAEFPDFAAASQIATMAAENADGDIRAALMHLYYAAAGNDLYMRDVAHALREFSAEKSVFEWTSYFFNARREMHSDGAYLHRIREGYYRESFFYPAVLHNYHTQIQTNASQHCEMLDMLSHADMAQAKQFTAGDWTSSKCAVGYMQAMALNIAATECRAQKFYFPYFPSIISIDKTRRQREVYWSQFCAHAAFLDSACALQILDEADADGAILCDFNTEAFADAAESAEWPESADAKQIKRWMRDAQLETQLRKCKKLK